MTNICLGLQKRPMRLLNRKKIIWMLISVLIAVVTIYGIWANNRTISPASLLKRLEQASVTWLVLAVISMTGFIIFEGFSLYFSLKILGTHTNLKKAVLYSAGDIFFSAITPSASGGQPASAFLMHRDNLSGATITVCLIGNLIMYTISGLTVGLIGFLLRPKMILSFSVLSRILILYGVCIGILLTVLFILLLTKSRFLRGAGSVMIIFLSHINLIRDCDASMEKFERYISEYELCSGTLCPTPGVLLIIYVFNLLQRLSQVCVTPLLHKAIKAGELKDTISVLSVQALSLIGSNFVPIPGGMGAADHLMLDGLGVLFERNYAYELQLISRGLSFYICTILSGLIVFAGCFIWGKKKENVVSENGK